MYYNNRQKGSVLFVLFILSFVISQFYDFGYGWMDMELDIPE